MNNHYQKVVFFALSLLFLGACNQAEVEKKEVLRPVRYIEVGSSETKMQRVFSGFARVGSDVTLSFRTSGVIIERTWLKDSLFKKVTCLASSTMLKHNWLMKKRFLNSTGLSRR
jgi:hypothetical protein